MKKKAPVTPFSTTLPVFSDDRGIFSPILQQDHELLKKHRLTIKRVYHVYNFQPGTVRGFHFHKHEWKFFTIVNGAAKFIALDPDHPNDRYSFISSVRKPELIIIPPWYANGWVSLEPNTILLCCSTASMEESIADDTRIDPYQWGDMWSVKSR